jgi:hypothetical protein
MESGGIVVQLEYCKWLSHQSMPSRASMSQHNNDEARIVLCDCQDTLLSITFTLPLSWGTFSEGFWETI